jgi:nitrite reductase/ring-hydroxylating ferredoxin subunit
VQPGTVLHRLAERTERLSALDRVADPLARTADRVMRAARVKNVLSGSWLGHPLHPLATDAVIGSWALAAVLDRRGENDAARTLVGLGVLAAVPTAASGASDWADAVDPRARRMGLVHAASNVVALLLNATSYFARHAGRHDVGARLTAGSAVPLTVGGFLGAHMAYARGIGVSRTAFEEHIRDWTPLAPAPTVAEGWTTAIADGLPVLVRFLDGDPSRALSGSCTHCGAALAPDPGQPDSLRCPTDGSVFSADDGSVLAGPATTPIAHFDARINAASDVEVRSPA